MTFVCRIRNGEVELPPNVNLPEGASVRVEVIEERPAPDARDGVYSIGDLAAETGIADLSVNMDHYLYGRPRVTLEC